MEIEERYTEIFAYLRRFECGLLAGQDIAKKLKEFIDVEEKEAEYLPLKYQNKLSNLKDYHRRLVDDNASENK